MFLLRACREVLSASTSGTKSLCVLMGAENELMLEREGSLVKIITVIACFGVSNSS